MDGMKAVCKTFFLTTLGFQMTQLCRID